jgi:hypothetical protein
MTDNQQYETEESIQAFLDYRGITRLYIASCESRLKSLGVEEIQFNLPKIVLHIGYERISAERLMQPYEIKVLLSITDRTDKRYSNEITGIAFEYGGILTCYPMMRLSFYKNLQDFFLEPRPIITKSYTRLG